jgi:hypothetical protein
MSIDSLLVVMGILLLRDPTRGQDLRQQLNVDSISARVSLPGNPSTYEVKTGFTNSMVLEGLA